MSNFLGGFGFGLGVAAVLAFWWASRQQQVATTGLPARQAARVRPATPEAEVEMQEEFRRIAIEKGTKNILELSARQGSPLTLDQARERATEVYDEYVRTESVQPLG